MEELAAEESSGWNTAGHSGGSMTEPAIRKSAGSSSSVEWVPAIMHGKDQDSGTATENSKTNAWNLNFGNGNLNNNNKATNQRNVRPVSALRMEEQNRGKMFTLESVIEAYYDCRKKKRRTANATSYEVDYECGLVRLCEELNARTYAPGQSIAFVVTRPRLREVFAADFRDRIVHHWMCLRLIPLLEQVLGERRFNCREGKGVLYGVDTLTEDIRAVSCGYTKPCFVAKGDIQGFFMSIGKEMLANLTDQFICARYKGADVEELRWVSRLVIMHSPEKNCVLRSPKSYWRRLAKNKSLFTNGEGLGVPIGNLPSQTLANLLLLVALDAVLGSLGIRWGGYVDDFYLVGQSKAQLLAAFPLIRQSLASYGLTLHPKKFYLQSAYKGITFTGVTVRPNRRYVGKRIIYAFEAAVKRLETCPDAELEAAVASVNSYMGLMIHHNTYAARRYILSRAAIFGRCYVEGKFKKVVIKHKRHETEQHKPTLALASLAA